MAGAALAAGTGTALAATSVPPVSHLSAGAVTASSLRLAWRWPSPGSVTSATVRMAKSATAPSGVSKGKPAGKVARPGHTLTVRKLSPYATYSFAVFAKGAHGHYARAATIRVRTHPKPLRISTGSLPQGVKGLSYLEALAAVGGVSPHSWSASGLPRGLKVSTAGVISGYPLVTGTRTVTIRVRDARHVRSTRRLRLSVPTSLPAGCVARSCAKLSKDGHTVQVPAADVTSVTRDPASGKVTSVGLSGITVAKGDVLVLAPASGIPSGLIAVVDSVTSSGGELSAGVSTATPADAYHLGVVQALGPAKSGPAGQPGRPAAVAAGAKLKCTGDTSSDLHGLTVTPSLTPELAAYWKHPLFGGKGFYIGTGGLQLFQFTLTGTIKVNLGVSVSGKSTCTLSLPSIKRLVPAGDLGAVLLELGPSLVLKTTGQVDVRTSVTLTCTAQYRWDQGKSYRTDFCLQAHQPLHLTAATGVDATLTGAIDASASLDDLPGVKGTIDASLHAGYHPRGQPVGEIDASADYELKATLANIWKHAPSLRIAHGTIFHQVLATYGAAPPGATGPPGISVSPDVALAWSDAVCGFDDPTFGTNYFTVAGTGFVPGEQVSVGTDWADYPGQAQAGLNGGFSVTNPVGEVPSVLYTPFGVYASGSDGSQASGSIELESDGCVDQSDTSGSISLQWGGNGFDPYSSLSLYIDDEFQDSASTDGYGSGGDTTSFDCPSSGEYTWDIYGYVNGQSVYVERDMDCAPASDASRAGQHQQRRTAAGAARRGGPPR
jgi:hypothetical protein